MFEEFGICWIVLVRLGEVAWGEVGSVIEWVIVVFNGGRRFAKDTRKKWVLVKVDDWVCCC
jgi:hypothetical protein